MPLDWLWWFRVISSSRLKQFRHVNQDELKRVFKKKGNSNLLLITDTNSSRLSSDTPAGLDLGDLSQRQYILTAFAIELSESKLRAKTGAMAWATHLTCCQVGSFQSELPTDGKGSKMTGRLKVDDLLLTARSSGWIDSRNRRVRLSTTSKAINFLLLPENSAKMSWSKQKEGKKI